MSDTDAIVGKEHLREPDRGAYDAQHAHKPREGGPAFAHRGKKRHTAALGCRQRCPDLGQRGLFTDQRAYTAHFCVGARKKSEQKCLEGGWQQKSAPMSGLLPACAHRFPRPQLADLSRQLPFPSAILRSSVSLYRLHAAPNLKSRGPGSATHGRTARCRHT